MSFCAKILESHHGDTEAELKEKNLSVFGASVVSSGLVAP